MSLHTSGEPDAPVGLPEGAIKVVGDGPHHYLATSQSCFNTSEDIEDLIARMKTEGEDFVVWFVPMDLHSDYKLMHRAPQVLGAHTLSKWTVAEKENDDVLLRALEEPKWSNAPY